MKNRVIFLNLNFFFSLSLHLQWRFMNDNEKRCKGGKKKGLKKK